MKATYTLFVHCEKPGMDTKNMGKQKRALKEALETVDFLEDVGFEFGDLRYQTDWPQG